MSTGNSSQSTTNTYSIQWLWGQDIELAFNPAYDVLDFGWFSGNSFTLSEINGSVVISIPSNQQTYTLTGVSFSDLQSTNVITQDSQAGAQWAAVLGDSGASDGLGAEPTPQTTEPDITGGFVMTWAWNQDVVVAFDPATDRIDFGWFGPDNFTVAEVDGSTVISVTGNQQTYTLQDVALADLSMDNIDALDNQ